MKILSPSTLALLGDSDLLDYLEQLTAAERAVSADVSELEDRRRHLRDAMLEALVYLPRQTASLDRLGLCVRTVQTHRTSWQYPEELEIMARDLEAFRLEAQQDGSATRTRTPNKVHVRVETLKQP